MQATQTIKPGDKVTYTSYGERKEGIVSHLGRNGAIVFLIGGRWLHRQSIETVNGEQA